MRGSRWVVAAGLALLVVAALAAGYLFGPWFVSLPTASAAQHQEVLPEATPAPAESKPATDQAWLGVAITTTVGGAQVAQVVPDSPAAKAGLKRGDTITAVDGNTVANANDLVQRIGALKPGDQTTLTVQRDGASQSITVTLGTRPKRPAAGMVGPKPRPGALGPFGAFGGLVPELRDVPADQRFDHLRGGSFSFTDKDGNAVTINITPGVLVTVTTDAITFRPNGASADTTLRISEKTRVAPGNRANAATNFKAQDKVVVVSRQGSDEAIAVQDLTAAQQQRTKPQAPRGSVWPGAKGQGFRFAPSDLQERLNQMQQRLNEFRQRLNRPQPGAQT